MSAPVVRRYVRDEQYTADAAQMASAGWQVIALQRAPDNTIVATYRVTTPRRAGWQRIARSLDHTALVVGAGLGATILLVLLVALLMTEMPAGATSGRPGSAGALPTATSLSGAFSATAYAATAEAIQHPQATATSAPLPVTDARLGSTLDAFTAVFGVAATSGSASAVWSVTIDGQVIQVYAETWQDAPRIWNVALSYLNASPPTTAENAAICRQFFPSDAIHTGDDTTYQPTEHLYQSQQLAASLPTAAFQNNAGADVTPGTFAVVYGTRDCFMAAGEN